MRAPISWVAIRSCATPSPSSLGLLSYPRLLRVHMAAICSVAHTVAHGYR